ncbi:MAG: transposase [Betaproteobacteria bacterium]
MNRLIQMHTNAGGGMPAVAPPIPAGSVAGPGRERRHYTLAEKVAIVRESQQPGISQASISRKHNLGKNVLWTWRKSLNALSGFALEPPAAESGAPANGNTGEQEVANLRDKISELERMLGQKAFEIEMLRSRLGGLQGGMSAGLRSVETTSRGTTNTAATNTATTSVSTTTEQPRDGDH